MSEATLAEVRARVSIVEVISAHIALRKAGRNYTGLCPFHGEKTPSFSVNEEGGFYHCFGCGVGGNAFTFLSRVEGISFPEAVRRLAAKAGVIVSQSEQRSRTKFMKDTQSSDFIDLQQATVAYPVSRRTFWNWISEGRLNVYKPFNRKVLLRRSEIDALLEATKVTNE